MHKILVVEDDPNISELLLGVLGREGYHVTVARDGRDGLAKFAGVAPDLVVLDWMLPEVDGLSVLKAIRKGHETPVLLLTVRDEEVDKVLGLELGADDYLTKPFGTRELVARIRTLLRRGRPRESTERVEAGPVEICAASRQVQVRGQSVTMTRTEFDLLLTLAGSPGRVFTRENLLDIVWGYRFEGYERTVDSHINHLRKKIEEDPRTPSLVETVWGVGYRFRIPAGWPQAPATPDAPAAGAPVAVVAPATGRTAPDAIPEGKGAAPRARHRARRVDR